MGSTSPNEDLIWYASYGSNLSRNRFLCYIRGGTPEGSEKYCPPCADNTLPRRDEAVAIPHQLYFAEHGSGWNGRGVAFISLSKTEEDTTFGRMYLITREQFKEVVSKENNNTTKPIDFARTVETGRSMHRNTRFYGCIMLLGYKDGFPIFTFTADPEHHEFNKPSSGYLNQIIIGLKECYALGNENIADYLIKKNGIRTSYTRNELLSLIQAGDVLNKDDK